MKTHELKTLPEYFQAVVDGSKTFEIRFNDRDFKVGDGVILSEWCDKKYTGRQVRKKISYMSDYKQRLNYVVLGLVDD